MQSVTYSHTTDAARRVLAVALLLACGLLLLIMDSPRPSLGTVDLTPTPPVAGPAQDHSAGLPPMWLAGLALLTVAGGTLGRAVGPARPLRNSRSRGQRRTAMLDPTVPASEEGRRSRCST